MQLSKHINYDIYGLCRGTVKYKEFLLNLRNKGDNEMKKNNKGFSLVELIIVIAIMAILVAVLGPQYLKFVERSRKSTDCQNAAELLTAIQVYCSEPTAPTGMVLITSDTTGTSFTITPKSGSTAGGISVSSGTNKDAIEDAFESALGTDWSKTELKSTEWNGTSGVTIKVTVDSAKNVTFEQTAPATTTGMDIIKGLYE